jgi:hypothetical protein
MEPPVLAIVIIQVKSLTGIIVHFINVKILTGLSTANPTVHDHGRGYSNSFDLCRGVHFTHKIQYICREQSTDHHTRVCRVQMIKQNLSLSYSSIRSFPRSPRHGILRFGTPSFARYSVLYEWMSPLGSEVSSTSCTSIKDDARYPILKQTSYGPSPFLVRGNVVVL